MTDNQHNTILSENNKSQNINQKNKENINKDITYELTPIESIILNMHMPKGIKIIPLEYLTKEETINKKGNKPQKNKSVVNQINKELEGILNKEESFNKPFNKPKKIRQESESQNSPIKEKHSLRQHKPRITEDLGYIDKDILKGKSNPLRASINKKCEKGFNDILKYKVSDFFYYSQKADIPCLSQIEKNIKNFKYKTIYEFIMDLRSICNFYFVNYENNKDIINKTSEMSKICEEMYKELDIKDENKNELKEINKKIDSLTRDLKLIKSNQPDLHSQLNLNQFKKNYFEKNNEKVWSISEKAQLKKDIELLTPQEKKGLLSILADSFDLRNKKDFELDIALLNSKKLKEIDKYVKNCIKKNKKDDINNKANTDINFIRNQLNDISNACQKKDDLPSVPVNNNINNTNVDNQNIVDSISSSESNSSSLSSDY